MHAVQVVGLSRDLIIFSSSSGQLIRDRPYLYPQSDTFDLSPRDTNITSGCTAP